LEKPVHLVIASTGITASTKVVVGDVKDKKNADPSWFDNISKEYNLLVHDGKDALIKLDLVKVGDLMNKNHELLQQLTVSCRELDVLVTIARQNGAIGSKMTGTGRGGNMIALAPDDAATKQIAEALKKEGRAAGVWTTSFGL
ncbi:MAG: mevalonate kinase, partial [Candidatus Thorarchaeota archaeon]